MKEKFYISIASNNLSHYLVGGIIVPSKYLQNKYPDFQDINKDSIILSRFKFINDSNCAIEIVLNEKEEILENIDENMFLFNSPLPISRIRKIYFRNNEQKVQTMFNIQSGIAFLPENIVEVSDESEVLFSDVNILKSKKDLVDHRIFIKLFDQIMGGISVMNIARESYQNFSTHFFVNLGNINSYFNTLLKKQGIRINNQFDFVFNDGGKFKDFYDAVFSDTSLEIVEAFARKEGINIETKNGVIQLSKIPESTQTYYVAVLENFGTGKRKQLDTFISELISGNLDQKRKEGIALIFGLNKGYKAFRNKYKTTNFEVDIKFKLNSKLDYFIIESIFQYVFNKIKEVESFDYIESWCNKAVYNFNLSNYKTYKILDTQVIYKKKQDFFEDYYQSFSQRKNKMISVVAEKINRLLPSFIKIDNEQAKTYFDLHIEQPLKELAIEIISNLQENIDFKEVEIANLEESILFKNEKIVLLEDKVYYLEKINADLEEKMNSISALKYLNKDVSLDCNIEDLKNNFEKNIEKSAKHENTNLLLKDFENNLNEINQNNFKLSNYNKDESESTKQIHEFTAEISSSNIDIKVNNQSNELFDNDFENNKYRRLNELKHMKVGEVRDIALNLSIKIEKMKKDEIIDEIINVEFN